MKRKFKLITSVASLCLALTMMIFGVRAATNPQITVTGTVSFSATNVLATISGVKGTGVDTTWTTDLQDIVYTVGTADAQSMDVGTISLTDAVTSGGYKITVTSDFASGSNSLIKITSELPSTITGTGYTVSYTGDANWTTATTTGLTAGASTTVTVTITVDPAVASATFTEDIGMSIVLERA